MGFLPAGSSSSNETLEDGLSTIDPSVFNGSAALGVISAQLSRGCGLTDIKLGGARTPPNGMQPNIGETRGYGEGALMMVGRSWLKVPPLEENCVCQ